MEMFTQVVFMLKKSIENPSDFFTADALFFIEAWKLTNCSNNPLSWASGSSDGLDRKPVVILLVINLLVVPTQIHAMRESKGRIVNLLQFLLQYIFTA